MGSGKTLPRNYKRKKEPPQRRFRLPPFLRWATATGVQEETISLEGGVGSAPHRALRRAWMAVLAQSSLQPWTLPSSVRRQKRLELCAHQCPQEHGECGSSSSGEKRAVLDDITGLGAFRSNFPTVHFTAGLGLGFGASREI